MSASACIIYSHGFNSGLNSFKYRWLQQDFASSELEVDGVNLSPWPQAAIKQLDQCIASHSSQRILLVGASLGGYYMQYLMQQYRLPAVLINPAIFAHERLEEGLGPQQNISTGVHWVFTEAMRQQLPQYQVSGYAQDCMCLLSCDDELLDYRQALKAYAEVGQVILSPNSGHRFADRLLLRQSIDYMLERYLKSV